MIELISEAEALQTFIKEKGWDFFFIGGIAVQVWGQTRLTRDIDLTIFTNLQNEELYIQAVLDRYQPRFSGVEQFALTERVLPVVTKSGIGIDLTLSGFADLSPAFERSSYQPFANNILLRVCSPDDLIIMKTVAARARDWVDIESIIIRQTSLDWSYIEKSIDDLENYEDISIRLKKLQQLKAEFYKT